MKKKIIILAIIFILIDQLTKLLIVNNLEPDSGFDIISSFFSIIYVRNTGAAWGILANGTLVLAILSIIFLLFAIKYILELKVINTYKVIEYSLLIGGIIGNLLDRLIRGYVVDFFSFNIFSYKFPVFNVADCFIVVAIILIMIDIIIDEKKKKGENNNDSEGK